jgi:hypothetical protein
VRQSSNVSFALPLSSSAVRTAGYAELTTTPRPSVLPHQTATSHAELVESGWTEVWTITDTMTQAEWSAKQEAAAVAQKANITITMRQCRLALLAAGKLAAVDAAIGTLPEPSKSAAATEWEYAHEVYRGASFVALLGAAIGFTEAEVDNLFVEAKSL